MGLRLYPRSEVSLSIVFKLPHLDGAASTTRLKVSHINFLAESSYERFTLRKRLVSPRGRFESYLRVAARFRICCGSLALLMCSFPVSQMLLPSLGSTPLWTVPPLSVSLLPSSPSLIPSRLPRSVLIHRCAIFVEVPELGSFASQDSVDWWMIRGRGKSGTFWCEQKPEQTQVQGTTGLHQAHNGT
jgi:hypothetical protein